MLHIYCGNGKGKTTAALGLAVRSLGHGQSAYLAQFLKSDVSGELLFFANVPNMTVLPNPERIKFIFRMTEEEKQQCRADCTERFRLMARQVDELQPSLVILDELLDVTECGMLAEEELLAFLRAHAPQREIVLTGRRYTPALEELADYITRMDKVKHPFDKGQSGRKGVEY